MAKAKETTTAIDPQIVDAVFSTNAEELVPVTKTVYYDEFGNEIANGTPEDTFTKKDYVARVSSMSLSIKVTPKIGNDYLSVERQMTVEVNTLDKKVVHDIWKNLQEQVTSGVFNTLTMTLKQLNDIKKGN